MKPLDRFTILVALVVCSPFHASSQWVSTLPSVPVNSLTTTTDAVFAGMAGGGVVRSTDHGMTWSLAVAGLPTMVIRVLAASGDRIYAGTDYGVFVSTDRGALWTAINQGLTELRVYSLAARDSLVLAGTMSGIFRSTDRGEHWTTVDLPSGYTTLIYSFAMNGSTVYAGTAAYHSMVFRSTDDGVSWSATTALGNVWALVIMGPRVVAGTDNGIRISRDEGATWDQPLAGPANRIVRSLLVHQGDLFAGTRGGVYVSTDSATNWMSLSSGLTDTVVSALTVDGQTVIGGSNGGLWTRTLTAFNGVPAAPLLRSPANNAVDQPRTVEFRWSRPDLTTTFHLQVGTDSTFTSDAVLDTVGCADTTMVVGGLKVGTRYVWRVAAANAHGAGSPSTVWTFATLNNAPLPPSLAWPEVNGWVYGGGNGLAWHPVPGASAYRYQVARDPAFASLVVDSTVTDTTGYGRLTQLGLHYWRVQSINDVGPGKFSDIRVFAAAWPPILATPLFGSTHVSTGTTLRWHPVPEATGYRITVALGQSWTGGSIVFNALVTDTSSRVEDLRANVEYCWQVHARYDSGGLVPDTRYVEGPVSSTWFFDTRTEKATEIFPLWRDRNPVYMYSRSYYHESGAKEWDVDTGTVAYEIMNVAYPNDSTALWNINEHANLLHHHWKVDQGDMLVYDSTYWRNSSTATTLTELLSGDHELLCVSRVWHFPQLPDSQSIPQWSGRTPVCRYWTDTARTITQYQEPPDTSRYQVLHFAVSRGLADREYFYKSSEGGVTTIREAARLVGTFYITEATPSVRPEAAILLQNFPNPFNPSTTVRYGLPERSRVRLAVFNTLGQEVTVLVQGEEQAGYHEVRFDGTKLPSGVYFYRLQSGSYTETKKLVLAR